LLKQLIETVNCLKFPPTGTGLVRSFRESGICAQEKDEECDLSLPQRRTECRTECCKGKALTGIKTFV